MMQASASGLLLDSTCCCSNDYCLDRRRRRTTATPCRAALARSRSRSKSAILLALVFLVSLASLPCCSALEAAAAAVEESQNNPTYNYHEEEQEAMISSHQRLLQDTANETSTEAPADAAAAAAAADNSTTGTTDAADAPADETTAPADAPADTTTTDLPPPSYTSFDTYLPPSVDVAACRKHLLVVDKDRNNVLTEEEYLHWIREIVSKDFNHSLVGIMENPLTDDLWAGKTLEEMPTPVVYNYHDLTQGGYIEVVGYRPSSSPATEPTLAQKLYLVKVCVSTETAVYQVFRQQQLDAESGETTTTTTSTAKLPEVKVLDVNSSFDVSNGVGITAQTLRSETNKDHIQLELAYATLVTQVVSDLVGMALIPPSATTTTTTEGSARTSGRRTQSLDGHRHRRLTVAIDPDLPELRTVEDIPCPGAPANQTEALQEKWCQRFYAKFLLYLVGEDPQMIFDAYSQAVQAAIAKGDLQQLFLAANPPADEDPSDVTVTGAGPSIFPPEPTQAPTQPPHPPPTVSPANITVPEEGQLNTQPTDQEDGEGLDMGLLIILACVLGSFNCLIITVSIYECWRNKKHHDEALNPLDDNIEAQWNKNTSTASSHNRKKKTKKQRSQRSNRSNQSGDSFYDEDDSELISNPPTLDEIAEANAPAPAPAPSMMTQKELDAQERDRILLSGPGFSDSTTDAPTLDEIQSKLSSIGETSDEEGSHAPLATSPAKAKVATATIIAVSYTHLTLPTNREV